MITLTPKQSETALALTEIVAREKYGVLKGEMRTGKTYMSLSVAKNLLVGSVLIVTKKIAIDDINGQVKEFEGDFSVEVINYESLHKAKHPFYDLIIFDEYHAMGWWPKTNLKSKVAGGISRTFTIGMTGTLFSETHSTAYSLFYWEFSEYKNFYAWFRDFGVKRTKYIGNKSVNDYSESAEDLIWPRINRYIVRITQEEAGFKREVQDITHSVNDTNCNKLADIISKKKIYKFKDGDMFVAENISREFHGVAQAVSGTLKIDDDNSRIFCDFKARYILANFTGKIAVYYKYKAERELLIDSLTSGGYEIFDSPEAFQEATGDVCFLGQFRSKREGVRIDTCDDMIFFSMPYSDLDYTQSRERIISKDKDKPCRVHFLLTRYEERIYDKVIVKKEKYITSSYRRDRNMILTSSTDLTT